jgi:TetR/AcrR family transcriptional regulator, transcriptional repressor for nem operon
MRMSKKQPEQTRKALLAAADLEFSLHGYSATGIGAIVLRSGLTKGALFHHFPDKQKLAAAWISEILAEGVRDLWVSPLDGAASLDDLQAICRRRCSDGTPDDATAALVAIAAEVGAREEILGEALESVFAAWRGAVAGLFERGRAGGWIHPSIQAELEAALLVSAFGGFSVSLRLSPTAETRQRFSSAFAAYLETLRV